MKPKQKKKAKKKEQSLEKLRNLNKQARDIFKAVAIAKPTVVIDGDSEIESDSNVIFNRRPHE